MTLFGTKQNISRRGTQPTTTLRNVVWGFALFILVSIVLASVWYVTRLPLFTISQIEVRFDDAALSAEVARTVERELEGSYLLLIPHRFTYLYPRERILEAVGSFTQLHDISVDRSDRKTLEVVFKEYLPFALWCSAFDESSLCYYVSDSGYAFLPAPELHGGTLTRHVIEDGGELAIKQVFDADAFRGISAFIERMDTELFLRVTDVFYTKDNDITLHVNGGGKILVSRTGDFTDVFENLVTVLVSKEFDHLEPGNFNYVDLRFGNKIFVNEEAEIVSEGATTTATSSEALPE